MFTKSFDDWLEEHEYAWFDKYGSKDAVCDCIFQHTQRGTSIGKVLNKMKLTWALPALPEHIINKDKALQAGVIAFNAKEYVAKVELVPDHTTVANAYRNIYSCMTDGAEDMGEFLTSDLLLAQGIRLATYTHRDEIVGRCIVNTATQGRCEVYSKIGGQEFTAALTEMGFSPESLTVSHLKYPQGQWIPYLDEIGGQDFIRCRIVGNEEWCFVMPENGNYSREAYERIQRIIPGFDGDLEYYDEVESDTWIVLNNTEE